MTEVQSNNVLGDWKKQVKKKAPNKLRCCLTKKVIEIPVQLKGENKYVYDAVQLNQYFQVQAATYGQHGIHHPIRKKEIMEKIEIVYVDSTSDELVKYLDNLHQETKFESREESEAVGQMLIQKVTWMQTIKETIDTWLNQSKDHRFYLNGLTQVWKTLTKYFNRLLKVMVKYAKKLKDQTEKIKKKMKKWIGVEETKTEKTVNEQWRKAHDETIKYDSEKNTVESDSDSDISDVSDNSEDDISTTVSQVPKPISRRISRPVSNQNYYVPKKSLNLLSTMKSSGGGFNIFKVIFKFVKNIVVGLFKFLWWLVKTCYKILVKIVSAALMGVGGGTVVIGGLSVTSGVLGGSLATVATGGLFLVVGACLFGIGYYLW